ncbi:MAG: galactosyldiacylglycerol synthase, partial [Candidatus Omnitrophica bacterium]|nr:galactosyldiacylglycerol synthase [Candidatus Omnitrophota bacterium]
KYKAKFLLYAVLTDYIAHSYWLYEDVDYYIVPSQETKDRLIHNGISAEKIRILGIPIDPKFAKSETSREVLYKKLGLRRNLPVVLIMGGGQGLGKIKDVVSSLDELRGADFQMAVVAGVNKRLLSWLKRKSSTFRRRVTTFGYTDNINELMEAASLIVTKPGGLSTAEALAKHLPLVVINPIPGQEAKNAEYLLKADVAVRALDEKDVAPLVKELLNNPDKLKAMREKASLIAKPFAASEISNLVLQNIRSRGTR